MSKDFLTALNRIVDAFDGIPGHNSSVDDLLTALDAIADAIENNAGSGSGNSNILIVHSRVTSNDENETVFTLDKTWKEIYDADVAILVESHFPEQKESTCVDLYFNDVFTVEGGNNLYTAETENDYPSCTIEKEEPIG